MLAAVVIGVVCTCTLRSNYRVHESDQSDNSRRLWSKTMQRKTTVCGLDHPGNWKSRVPNAQDRTSSGTSGSKHGLAKINVSEWQGLSLAVL